MDTLEAKIISIIILIFTTLLAGWLPIGLSYYGCINTASLPGSGALDAASRRRKRVLDFLNCFAGGVFLGTCLLHLLAEGREEFEDYLNKVGFSSDFPFYELTVGLGVFLIAVVEKVGFSVLSKKHRDHSQTEVQAGEPGSVQSISSPSRTAVPEVTVHTGYGTLPACENGGPVRADRSQSGHGKDTAGEQSPLTSSIKQTPKPGLSVERRSQISQDGAGQETDHHHHSLISSSACEPEGVPQLSMVRTLLLLLALSFHTVFDGLAVGLQESETEVWQVLAAITIHKTLVSFCLGIEFVLSCAGQVKRPLIFLFIFSFISPVGICIGIGITTGEGDSLSQMLASSVLQALATGTFLYVTFFEILGQQFVHSATTHALGTWHELAKVAVAVVGFGGMAAAKLLDKD